MPHYHLSERRAASSVGAAVPPLSLGLHVPSTAPSILNRRRKWRLNCNHNKKRDSPQGGHMILNVQIKTAPVHAPSLSTANRWPSKPALENVLSPGGGNGVALLLDRAVEGRRCCRCWPIPLLAVAAIPENPSPERTRNANPNPTAW